MVHDYDYGICKKHGRLYILFYDHEFAPFQAIYEFIHSREQDEFDRRTMNGMSQDELYHFDAFDHDTELPHYEYDSGDKDKLYWMGYLMQYVGYHEEKPVSELFLKNDIIWLWENYDALHTQDCLYVWELITEKRQKRRNIS